MHLKDWVEESKLKPENGGSWSRLAIHQESIVRHLEDHLYTKVQDICAYVETTFQIHYTVSGMTQWLHQQGFSYKKPKEVPAKADPRKQEAFIEQYAELLASRSPYNPIFFMDSCHPTMTTKVSGGWIRKGEDKAIQQGASRTRVNVTGAIDLSTMQVVTEHPDTVNGETTVNFLKKLKDANPDASKLHVILDQSGYHRSEAVRAFAGVSGIDLHYLPPYSPNLNPIERLWKVMNEHVRNNHFFKSAKEFREAISDFFEQTLSKIAQSLRDRINDNFQRINPAPSG